MHSHPVFRCLGLDSCIGHYCWLELLEQAGANKSKFSKIINTHQLELTSKQSNVHIMYLLSSQEYNNLNEKKTQNVLIILSQMVYHIGLFIVSSLVNFSNFSVNRLIPCLLSYISEIGPALINICGPHKPAPISFLQPPVAQGKVFL